MPFLLRVELPDVPGSLGMLATALGGAGADIQAIEIVEHRPGARVIDDVVLELPPMVMPDELVTACQTLDGVKVHWVTRYAAGASLSMDLEAVEAFTSHPSEAIERLIGLIPTNFRADWAFAMTRGDDGSAVIIEASGAAPEIIQAADAWLDVEEATVLPEVPQWSATLLAADGGKTKDGQKTVVVVGRHGGPEFLSSELARIGHMVTLAISVQVR